MSNPSSVCVILFATIRVLLTASPTFEPHCELHRRTLLFPRYHEVRNPLNGTVGWLRELNDADTGRTAAETRLLVTNALECTELALTFLNSLTIMVKLDTKLIRPHPVPALLNEALFRKIATLLRPQLRQGVELVIDAPSDDELGEVVCDTSLLTHVLLNIGQNAARFTAAGSIHLVCSVQELPATKGGQDDTPNLFFAIRDTGPGIPDSSRRSLFSRYTTDGGIGIGLFLAYQLVATFGSTLNVRSPWAADGSTGTSFEFTLPLQRATTDATLRAPAPAPASSQGKVAITQTSDGVIADATSSTHGMQSSPEELQHDLRVLVADDMAYNRQVAAKIFSRFSWDVTEVESAEQVIERLLHTGEQYDILVIDEAFSPGLMLGSEAIRLLRSKLLTSEGQPPLFIISCTGSVDCGAMSGKESALLQAGANLVWSKPLPNWVDGTLQRQLAAHLADRWRARGGTAGADDAATAGSRGEACASSWSSAWAGERAANEVAMAGEIVVASSLAVGGVQAVDQPPRAMGEQQIDQLMRMLPHLDRITCQTLLSSDPAAVVKCLAPLPAVATSSSGARETIPPRLEGESLPMPVHAAPPASEMTVIAVAAKLPRGLRAIIADDGKVNRMLLARIFGKFGWSVVEAATAEELLERTVQKGEVYDIIVVDEHFGLGRMLGSAAMQELRANLSGAEVIIHCTAEDVMAGASCWPADVKWGKPIPDWRNGELQRSLMRPIAVRCQRAVTEKVADPSAESSC